MGLLIGVGDSRPQSAYDYWYGIEWDVTVSNPHPTRIGKKELHKELPLQNMMRGCLLKDDGSVNYYLHANDSTKRDNGANADLPVQMVKSWLSCRMFTSVLNAMETNVAR